MPYETKDSGERQQFASGMQRDVTEGKTKWHLVFSGPMLERWAKLMTRGAIKYDDNNWMKADSGDEYQRFKESAFRHFMQWYEGDEDEDHAAAIYFNVNGAEYTKGNIPMHAATDWSYLANQDDFNNEAAELLEEQSPITDAAFDGEGTMTQYREQLAQWNKNVREGNAQG